MKTELLDLIVCPTCQKRFDLEVTEEANEEILEGKLSCLDCGRVYPIIKGIPRILPASAIEDNYASNFQYYWRNLNWKREDFNRRRFYELTEWKPEDLKGKFVLDAGCGGGRWTWIMAEAGANVIALDYTMAVEYAKAVCQEYPNVQFIQGDIFNLPFRSKTFEIVHCHGVLMATPDTKEGTRCLAQMTKEGGELAILVYREITKQQRIINEAVRAVTKRIPPNILIRLCTVPTSIEYLMPRVVLLYVANIVHLSEQPDWTLKLLHNYEWYSCQYQHRQSVKEVVGWYQEFGFEDIKVLNTNEVRKKSKSEWARKWRTWAVEHNMFLKSTIGVRGTKKK